MKKYYADYLTYGKHADETEVYKAADVDSLIANYERVLRECLRVFDAPNFTDRHDYAGMIRKVLKINL